MAVIVVEGGLSTTVQDLGRRGYQASGFTPSGVMDWRAASLGNALVGNPATSGVLEYALCGPTLRFEEAGVFALTGAEPAGAELDGRPVPPNRAVSAPAGSTLRVGPAARGQFGYVCLTGGVDTPPAMGSRSTSVRYGLGGLAGRALRAGDAVPLCVQGIGELPAMDARAVWAEDSAYGWQSDVVWVRVVRGPDERALGPEAVRAFYAEPFTVTARSDRMGFRLSGPALVPEDTASMASEGIAMGTVQVPAQGEPIVVMADHQTVGGYRKMATVISSDLPRLAQCTPGRRVRFEAVSVEKAQEVLRADAAYVRDVRRRIERAALEETQRP